MKTSKEFFGLNSIKKLEEILKYENPRKIFLVTGKQSYKLSGAQKKIKKLLLVYPYIHFSDFSQNPKIEDIKKGIQIYKKEECDLVIAIGGGSVIDTAKLINILAQQSEDPEKYIFGEKIIKKGKILVAIPTTSGSGSEVTHFAVIYIDKQKYSLAHQKFILPDYVILDASLTFSAPPYLTASTGMDALGQAIESFWAINSTNESKEYAKEAIKIILNNIEKVVNNPSKESRDSMIKASNLAGKAINISKTTASHALSYPLTSHFKIPHGHAVALTLGPMLRYNFEVSNIDLQDKRGLNYVKETFEKLIQTFGANNIQECTKMIYNIMNQIGLKIKLRDLNIKKDDIEIIIKDFNPERAKNNPRKLDTVNLKKMLLQIY